MLICNLGLTKLLVIDSFSGKNEFTYLNQDMEDLFAQFRLHNESKNIFKAARTPAVFFSLAVAFYILSGIFGLFGIYVFANMANLLMGMSLVTLITWCYVRYSGEMIAVGETIDDAALLMWESFMKPTYELCVAKGLEHAVQNSTAPALSAAIKRSTNGRLKKS